MNQQLQQQQPPHHQLHGRAQRRIIFVRFLERSKQYARGSFITVADGDEDNEDDDDDKEDDDCDEYDAMEAGVGAAVNGDCGLIADVSAGFGAAMRVSPSQAGAGVFGSFRTWVEVMRADSSLTQVLT